MQWFDWQHCWHHVMPTLVQMVSVTKIVMLHLISIAIDLRNAMVPLMTLSVPGDTDTNSITDQKSEVLPHFSYCNLRSTMLPLMILFVVYYTDASASDINYQKAIVHLISIIFLRNVMRSLTTLSGSHDVRADTMMSHDQKAMLHLLLIFLT